MIVVNPWDWLQRDGSLPDDNPRLRKRALRVAQLIESGGPLPKRTARETLLSCCRRPKGKRCMGLLWVLKTEEDLIVAHCLTCGHVEAMIHNWQETIWASGPMVPEPILVKDNWELN